MYVCCASCIKIYALKPLYSFTTAANMAVKCETSFSLNDGNVIPAVGLGTFQGVYTYEVSSCGSSVQRLIKLTTDRDAEGHALMYFFKFNSRA